VHRPVLLIGGELRVVQPTNQASGCHHSLFVGVHARLRQAAGSLLLYEGRRIIAKTVNEHGNRLVGPKNCQTVHRRHSDSGVRVAEIRLDDLGGLRGIDAAVPEATQTPQGPGALAGSSGGSLQ
jgi:hypothetical protein